MSWFGRRNNDKEEQQQQEAWTPEFQHLFNLTVEAQERQTNRQQVDNAYYDGKDWAD